LIGLMAPLIEVIAVDKPGKRSRELLALSDEELAHAVAPSEAAELLAEAGRRDIADLRESMRRDGLMACCRHDARFPEALRDDPQAPRALFARGEFALVEDLEPEAAVTVVGARRASAYGADFSHSMSAELAAAGLTVISGMALGVDSRAHEGALGVGGRTVAVLGSGADVANPASLRRLYEQIAARGLVLSELPPGARPYRWTFPARNRIMAALAGITVVVEAAVRSGSLITATMAGDLGREVGAVPGDVGKPLSEGTNALLRDGAIVVCGAQDVLDAMLGAGAPRLERAAPELSPDQAVVFDLVGRGHSTADAVASAAGLGVGESAAALTRLELIGVVRCDSSGRYRVAA
jgi:DNA processing protein